MEDWLAGLLGGGESRTSYQRPASSTERGIQEHAGMPKASAGGGGKSYGAAPAGTGAMGDPQWLQLLKAGANPDFINTLMRDEGKGFMKMSQYGAFHKDAGNTGMQKSRQTLPSVRSSFRPGGSSLGQPAPARAGAKTQQQQDHDAYFERRRQKEQMDMEMAQKLKMLSALGVGGGLPNQVSEYESTGQLYNNAGQHKVMPIETRRTRDVTPQERAQFYQSIFGR